MECKFCSLDNNISFNLSKCPFVQPNYCVNAMIISKKMFKVEEMCFSNLNVQEKPMLHILTENKKEGTLALVCVVVARLGTGPQLGRSAWMTNGLQRPHTRP